jgi:Carboxypeptidase regulatory-like domain
MGRGSISHLAVAVVAALLLAMAAPAAAQLQTGDLYGTVIDAQGQPLPGVTITLSGTSAPQVQTSGEDGRFRFLNLYPGTYDLKAELQGFSSVEYPDIVVSIGSNTSLEVTLSGAVEDVITVTGESPILDERKTVQGASVSAVELDKVPTARDPWALLSQAPGVVVDRINVGGNESGQQSNFLGMGSSSRDNTFAVDGVILTDMNAVGASATYFDFGAFEEVQFTVSSTDVTVATAGVTINQVTKRGTNEWRGAARYLRADGELQSDPPIPNGNRIDSVEEYGADFGGPLWRDHLWGWASYGESDIRNIVPSTNPALPEQPDTTQLEDLNTKLNFQAGANNSGVLHYWKNDKLKFGRSAGPTRAPETTHNQTTPQDIYKIEDTHIFNSSFVLTGLWAKDEGAFTLSPQGGLDADRIRTADGVLRGTTLDFAQDAVIEQARADGSYFFNLGPSNNELKFGGGFREQENFSGTVWPRGKHQFAGELNDIEGNTEMVVFPRNRNVGILSSYDSFWVQDTISLDRWTINAGLRYDNQTVENLPSSDPGNPLAPGGLIPALNFQGNDAGGFEWETIVPRVGVTYALGEDRQTLLRGTFSQYAEQLGQLPLASRVNPVAYSYAYFYFTDANGNLVLDPNEFGSLEFAYTYNIDPDNPAALLTPNINDPNLDPTMTDEITFGIDQGFGANFAAGITLTYRNIYDIPEERILVVDDATGQTRLATRNDWVPSGTVCGGVNDCLLPNGQDASARPVWDLRDGLTPTGGSFYTNGDREQDYLGVTLSVNRRLVNRWSFRGHFTYSDWEWNIGDEFRFYDDPTDTISDGLGFSDGDDVFSEQSGSNKANIFTGSRWSFGLNGLYQVAPDQPWGFNVGAGVNGREGFITPPFVTNSSAFGGRSIQLTSDLDAFRNDDIIVLDAHIDKDFRIGDVNLNVGIDGFNLTNESYVLQRERNLRVTRANQINETLSPRVFRVGATLRFR